MSTKKSQNIGSIKENKFCKVDNIVKKYSFKKSNLIVILQEIQKEYRYLPQQIMNYVATIMNLPVSHVFGVATFYSQFSLTPKGRYEIKVCDGTACHVRGSDPIIKAIKKKLELTKDKLTTDDMMFSFETVSCLGACGLAPVVVINEKVYPKMTPGKIEKVLDELKKG